MKELHVKMIFFAAYLATFGFSGLLNMISYERTSARSLKQGSPSVRSQHQPLAGLESILKTKLCHHVVHSPVC